MRSRTPPCSERAAVFCFFFVARGCCVCAARPLLFPALSRHYRTPSLFNEEKAQGVFFLPQSIDASHLVRETATLNEHESPSIHWGVQVIRRSPRPLQKTALQSPMFPGDAESGAKRNEQRGSPRVHPPDPVGSGGWPEGDLREPSLFNLTC